MFNYATNTTHYRTDRVLGGLSRSDADSYRTLFCGKLQQILISFPFQVPIPLTPTAC